MSNSNQTGQVISEGGQSSGLLRLMIAEWPYVLLYVAVLVGVGYTDINTAAALDYWQILIPLFGLLALVIGWGQAGEETGDRIAFAIRTILHWAALFGLVRLLYLPQLRDVLNNEIMGLVMIFLLGFTAFLAGIHGNPRMSLIGLFLALSGVAIAFLDDAAVSIMGLLAVIALVGSILWRRFASRPAS